MMTLKNRHYWAILISLCMHIIILALLWRHEITTSKEIEETLLELEYLDLDKLKKEEEEIAQKAKNEVSQLLYAVAVNENQTEESSSESPSQKPFNLQQPYTPKTKSQLRKEGSNLKLNIEKTTPTETLEETTVSSSPKETDKWQSTFYKGASSVSYNLRNRYKLELPIPVYKCEDGGKVVVQIQVSREGFVNSASVIRSKSKGVSECLLEAARDAALSSFFNKDINSPHSQQGTITYNFIAQ